MIKKCIVCGKTFSAKRDHAKYCSARCKESVRWGTSRAHQLEAINERNMQIVAEYDSDLNTKEIARKYGVGLGVVYGAWRNAGLPKRPSGLQKKVLELRKLGMSYPEIANNLGCSPCSVRQAAVAVGVPYSHDEKERFRQKSVADRISVAEKRGNKFFTDNYPGWLYISGLLGGDGYVQLECAECGSIVEKSAVTIRHHKALICPVCENRHRVEQARKKEAEKKQQRIKKFWSQDFEQLAFELVRCKECGCYYSGKKSGFCSEKCKRRYLNRAHDKRINRASRIDRTITLEKLYKRDGGVCWLCGGKCDYADYSIDDKNHFIVGPNYPSVDHVQPLSKGGNHVWDNVKLAHHYCNTLKNDKVVAYG